MAIKPLRVIHISDLHLGYRRYTRLTKHGFNQREVDVCQAFQEAVERIIGLAPDIVVVSGDVFHTVRPSNAMLTFAFRAFRRIIESTQARVVLVAGNHETPRRADSGNPLRLLAELPRTFVIDTQVAAVKFPEISCTVTGVPHASVAGGQRPTIRADDASAYNVLVAHAQLTGGWSSDLGGEEIALEELHPYEFDYVALGHYHVRQDISPHISYAGAIEHTGMNIWSEAVQPKGFLEVKLESTAQTQRLQEGRSVSITRTFHALTSPREIVVHRPIDAAGLTASELVGEITDRIENTQGGAAGKLIRLEVNRIPREIWRLLDVKALKKLKAEPLHFALEMRVESEVTARSSGLRTGGKRLKDELAEYIARRDPPVSGAQQVTEKITEVIEKIEAQNEAPAA